jgi:hypothetical protein
MDPNKYTYFVLLPERIRSASYGFTSYTNVDGDACYIDDGRRDKHGNLAPRKFKFSLKERTMRIPNAQKDKKGQSIVEFLKGHPECVGSPNAGGAAPWFKVLDTEADAQVAIDAKKLRLKAENMVVSWTHEELKEIGALFGVFSPSDAKLMHKLMELAGHDPNGFLDVVTDPVLEYKSLVKRAINAELFRRTGTMISWDEKVIGSDEDIAASALMKNDELREAVEYNLNKMEN